MMGPGAIIRRMLLGPQPVLSMRMEAEGCRTTRCADLTLATNGVRLGQAGVPVVLEQKITIFWKRLYLLASLKDAPGWVGRTRQTAEVGKKTSLTN